MKSDVHVILIKRLRSCSSYLHTYVMEYGIHFCKTLGHLPSKGKLGGKKTISFPYLPGTSGVRVRTRYVCIKFSAEKKEISAVQWIKSFEERFKISTTFEA